MKQHRIFLTLGGKATPGDKSNIWVKNLYDPLLALGHDVYLFDIDEYAESGGLGYMSLVAKEKVSNELPRLFNLEHQKKPFDIFFSYLHNGQIIPAVLKEIKKKVFTINYSTNYHQFDMYKEIAGIVDQNIYISKIGKAGFDGIGAKGYWMPLAANPAFYTQSSTKNNHAVFIGSAYGPRAYLFWRLLQYGIDLQLYGHGWVDSHTPAVKTLKGSAKKILSDLTGYTLKKDPAGGELELELRHHYNQLNATVLSLLRKDFPNNLHAGLSDTAYVQQLAEAGIVVNIQESRFNHDYFNHNVLFGSNLRDYEATMCGSFLCTQYSQEIEELFDIGKEIVCYHNEHDLADLIGHYTKNTHQRQTIAKAGFSRSRNNHTWERRFTDFFDFLNFK